jgi:hypothetical protein
MKKMVSVVRTIRALLDMVPGIQYAFIYSPFPKKPSDLEGEVEVMVVGGPDLPEIDHAVTKAEGK